MTSDKIETPTSDEELDRLRAEVRRVTSAEYDSGADAARDSGIAYSTFQSWVSGTYNGDDAKVGAKIRVWLDQRAERAKAAAAMPKVPGFQPTKTAQRILTVLTFAQATCDFAAYAGAPGIGKTTALEHYRDTHPNVWLATMDPSTSGVTTMMRELLEVMNVQERSLMGLGRAIGAKVKGVNGLIVVDEAQHLSSAALDQLRSLHDRFKVGVVVAGNATLFGKLEGEGGRRAHFAQLFSRLGMRHTQRAPHGDDVCTLIKAWSVQDETEIKYLKAIARKPGALRVLTKTLILASMVAASEAQPRGIKHIKQAWSQLSDSESAADAA